MFFFHRQRGKLRDELELLGAMEGAQGIQQVYRRLYARRIVEGDEYTADIWRRGSENTLLTVPCKFADDFCILSIIQLRITSTPASRLPISRKWIDSNHLILILFRKCSCLIAVKDRLMFFMYSCF